MPARRAVLLAAAVVLLADAAAVPAAGPPPPAASQGAASASAVQGEVTIPARDYQELLAAAAKGRDDPARSKGDALVDGARFVLTVDGDQASFIATFRARSDAAEWTSLAVLAAEVAEFRLEPAGGAFLFTSPEGVATLALPGPGTWTATLRHAPVVAVDADGLRHVRVKLPPFPVQRGRVEIAGTGLDVVVGGGPERIARSEEGGRTVVDVAGRPGATLDVGFRGLTREQQQASGPLQADGLLYARSSVVGADLVTDVRVRVTPRAGSLGGVELEVPEGARVLFLRGPDLLAWEEAGGKVRAARATPSAEPLGAELRFARPLGAAERVELPLVRLSVPGKVDAYVELKTPEGWLAEASDAGSTQVVDPARVPAPFRELAAEADEVLHVDPAPAPRAPRYTLHRVSAAEVLTAQVRALRGRSLVSASGRALSEVSFEVLSSAKTMLALTLPPRTTLWGASSAGRPIVAAAPEPGTVALPLRSGRGRLARVVVYLLTELEVPASGTLELPLPASDIPVASLEWSFAFPPDVVSARLEGSDYVEGPAAERGGAPAPAADLAPAGDLARRAREAMAESAGEAARTPIVPVLPPMARGLVVHADLPASPPRPLRVTLERKRTEEGWR